MAAAAPSMAALGPYNTPEMARGSTSRGSWTEITSIKYGDRKWRTKSEITELQLLVAQCSLPVSSIDTTAWGRLNHMIRIMAQAAILPFFLFRRPAGPFLENLTPNGGYNSYRKKLLTLGKPRGKKCLRSFLS